MTGVTVREQWAVRPARGEVYARLETRSGAVDHTSWDGWEQVKA